VSIEEVLDGVDWSPWEAQYKRTGLGQPPIHPRHVAAGIRYGLYRGIRSSRKLDEACCYRLDFMWLVEGRRIDHTTFAKFRTKFHDPRKDLFRQIGATAMGLGLISLGVVAFDGTRVKANNSRFKTRTAKTLEEKLQALDKVKTEWRWAVTAFNVVKLVRAIGRLRAECARACPRRVETAQRWGPGDPVECLLFRSIANVYVATAITANQPVLQGGTISRHVTPRGEL
jgi:transposase